MVTCGSRGHVAARGCSRPPRAVGLQRKGPQWPLRAGPTERRGTDSGDVPERSRRTLFQGFSPRFPSAVTCPLAGLPARGGDSQPARCSPSTGSTSQACRSQHPQSPSPEGEPGGAGAAPAQGSLQGRRGCSQVAAAPLAFPEETH